MRNRPATTYTSVPEGPQFEPAEGIPMSRQIRFGRGAVMKLRQLLVCQHPFAYCDGCLAHHLDISLADARAAAVTVRAEAGFIRHQHECYGCRRVIELTAMARGQ